MFSDLPVARSPGARTLFFVTAFVTAGLVWWVTNVSLWQYHLTAIFYTLFVTLDYQAGICLTLILVAALFVRRFPSAAILHWIGEHPLGIAAGAVLVLCAGSLLVYQNHPLAMDEYAPYLQSQAFAHGHLTGHFPPALLDWLIPPIFQNYFISVSHTTGAVASNYWPSFALLLTPFTLLGIPWACNPVISALTLVVVHRIAMRIYGDSASAGLAVLLTVASPVWFANGISYYSMPAHLLANGMYALLLLDPTPRRGLLAGFVGSIALTLHNPVPHMLFAAPWLISIARRPGGLPTLGALALGYLPLCLLLGFGWLWLIGEVRYGGVSLPGGAGAGNILSGLSVFAFPDEGILMARVIGLAKVWLWAVPGLMLLAVIGAWKWRRHPACRLFVASALLTLAGYLLVPVDQGHGWGYRYFHSVWIALPLLGAGALARLPQPARTTAGTFEDEDTRTFVVACALLTLVLGVGFRAYQIREFMVEDLRKVPAYTGTEHRIVILDPRFAFYGADLVQNDPFLGGNVIRMFTHGPAADAQMMARYFPEMHRVYVDRFGTVWSMERQLDGTASTFKSP
jgi:hypothetical protein